MKLFRQLFGKTPAPAPVPETLESKLKKLEAYSVEQLEALAKDNDVSSDEISLRAAAVERLAVSHTLYELASKGDVSSVVEKAARQRLAYFIDNNEISLESLLKYVSDTEKLLAIASFCRQVDLEAQVLAQVDDQEMLAKLCQSATSASVRQSLAERIESPELLKELSKSLKSKDKKAYKIIKSKLDVIREQEHKAAELKSKLESVCEEAEQQAKRNVDKDYISRHNRIKRHWQDVISEADEAVQQRFNSAMESCEKSITQYHKDLDAARELEAKVSSLDQDRHELLGKLWTTVNSLYDLESADDEALGAIQKLFEEYKNRWNELKSYGKPNTTWVKTYTQMCDAIDTISHAYKDKGSLIQHSALIISDDQTEEDKQASIKYLRNLLRPIRSFERMENNYPSNENVNKTTALLKRLEADSAAQEESYQKQIRLLGGLIRKANQATEQGRLKQAIGMRHSIDEKTEAIGELPSNIQRNLESLDEAIQKLVDWQAYAVVPKKNDLIEAMEKLVGADLAPEALATKIKKLQSEWKELNQSGKDRNEELWQRFSELADKAYEPCKVYYQELADTRSANLEKRQKLVSQLETFYQEYNWDKADWKHVEKIIRTARSELHSYSPVERAANKSVSQSFDAAMTNIQTKLNDEFAKNKASKEQLITQAENITKMDDLQQATDAVKRLQAQWKTIGRCHYRDSDQLWKDFRAHCDAIFDKKNAQYEQRKAEIDKHIEQTRSIVDKVVALSTLEGDELLAARSQRDLLQQEFSEVENLPEKVMHALQRDLGKALEKFENKIEQLQKGSETQAWKVFFDACKKVNNYCYTYNENQGIDDTTRDELTSFIASIEQWPEGGQSVISEKIASVEKSQENLNTDNLKALKMLCIRAEILADRSSPEDDKDLRMEYQVNLLQKGMGRINEEKSGAKIAKEWVKVGPVEDDVYQTLFDRFYNSWSVLPV